MTIGELVELLVATRAEGDDVGRVDSSASLKAMHDRINELVGELHATLSMVKQLEITIDRLRVQADLDARVVAGAAAKSSEEGR